MQPTSAAGALAGQLLRQRMAAVKQMLPVLARMQQSREKHSYSIWGSGDSIAKWKFWGRSDYGMPPMLMRRIDAYQPREFDLSKKPEHDFHKFDWPESREAGVPPQYDLRRSGMFRACMVGEALNKQLQAPINVHIPKFYKDRGQCVLIEPKHTRDHRLPPNPGFTNDSYRRFWTFLYFMLFDLFLIYLYTAFDFVIAAFDIIWSFWRIEIWVDRTGKNRRLPPWDWERARNNYTKLPEWWFNFIIPMVPEVKSKKYFVYDLNEALNDKMLEAARQRGTR